MTMNIVSDGIMAGCHVVGKYPALGVAICLGIGGAFAGVIPVTLTNPPQYESTCTDAKEFFLIDIAGVDQNVSVGDCIEDPDAITRAELQQRCLLPAAKQEELCAQL